MRKINLISLVVLGLLLVASMVVGQKSESNSQRLIKSAKLLEEKPLDKEAKKAREWALKWVIETDEVTVTLCSLILGVEKKYKFAGELTAQYAIGMAAFKLANPEKASDEGAAQLAGIESTIAAYESMAKTEAKAKSSFMDQLAAKKADGSLAQYLSENNCKDKK